MNTHSAEEAGSSPSSSTTATDLHHPQEVYGARLDQAQSGSTNAPLVQGDRIESPLARRPGTVVKVYPDGSACVHWDDGEPQEAGLGHERVPRNLLVKVSTRAAPTDAAAGDVNDGGACPTEAPKVGANDSAKEASADNIRRVNAKLQVHWAGRVFDVAQAGLCIGDNVTCEPAPISPFLWVRKIDATGQDHMATMVQPIEPTPQATPPDPALTRRKEYLLERMSVVLRYAASTELGSVDDALEDLVSLISRRRYVPGLVAADYDLTRKYWILGGGK